MPGVLGKLITFEGGEGVGKSTLVKSLSEWLIQKSVSVVATREPGGTPLADGIRALFKSPPEGELITPEAEVLLVSAARAQHVAKVILPALEQGSWVVCDRYIDSTRVYQGLLNGISMRDIEWLIKFSTGGLLPDITFLLDCDVDVTRARIAASAVVNAGRDDSTRYDQADRAVHEQLRRGFRKVAGFFPGRFYILDASLSGEEVFTAACKEIEQRWFRP